MIYVSGMQQRMLLKITKIINECTYIKIASYVQNLSSTKDVVKDYKKQQVMFPQNVQSFLLKSAQTFAQTPNPMFLLSNIYQGWVGSFFLVSGWVSGFVWVRLAKKALGQVKSRVGFSPEPSLIFIKNLSRLCNWEHLYYLVVQFSLKCNFRPFELRPV